MSRAQFAATSSAAATSLANRLHNQMIQTVGDYADAVRKGQITAWAIPYQSTSTTFWYVNVKARCLHTLSAPERAGLVADE